MTIPRVTNSIQLQSVDGGAFRSELWDNDLYNDRGKMATTQLSATFKVLDVMGAPHGGMILRMRLQDGDAPTLKAIKSAKLVAEGPDGESCTLKVEGFAVFGGKASDARLSRTGRIDVRVESEDASAPRPGLQWMVRLA